MGLLHKGYKGYPQLEAESWKWLSLHNPTEIVLKNGSTLSKNHTSTIYLMQTWKFSAFPRISAFFPIL